MPVGFRSALDSRNDKKPTGFVSRKNMAGIYCIKNILNGKMYFGQSKHPEQRLGVHKSALRGGYHENPRLQRAWDKYGEESFQCFVVEFCDEAILDDLETSYISKYETTIDKHGYNIELGGRGKKKIVSQETRRKISWSLTGRKVGKRKPITEETRKKLSESHKGHIVSEETRVKMSKARMGRVCLEETRRKISQANTGKPKPSLMGNKYSLGKKHSKETKEKMSQWHKGKSKSEKTIQKMKAAAKKRWEDMAEETKEKLLRRLRNPVITDESRKKMSESRRRMLERKKLQEQGGSSQLDS